MHAFLGLTLTLSYGRTLHIYSPSETPSSVLVLPMLISSSQFSRDLKW